MKGQNLTFGLLTHLAYMCSYQPIRASHGHSRCYSCAQMRGIKKNINTKGSHLYSLFPNKNTKSEGKGKKSDLRMNIFENESLLQKR